MNKAMIRTDKWPLQATAQQKELMRLTLHEYRAFCRAVSIVILNNWPVLCQADSFCAATERLIHPTAKNPETRHTYFQKRFYKFPSYLRRAAIEFAKGQVSSYLTRYAAWQRGERKSRTAKPPVFNSASGCYPAMYRGQLFKFNEDYTRASLKLWDGKEWLWHDMGIKKVRQRHLQNTMKSPSLIVGKHCHLSVPFSIKKVSRPSSEHVCSVDVGINTLAVASIVSRNGTVAARRFFHPAADIDRRDKRCTLIRAKARKTAKLSQGFCSTLYRKVHNYNEHIAQAVSRQLVNFALEQGVDVIALENLKGWRPKAGAKRSSMKQRFHTWLHRRLATLIEQKFTEVGGKVVYVYARGTSSWAFDGSGRIKRNPKQHELATFASGKQYNADLNASYNIGARYWAWKLKLTHRKDGQLPADKSSAGKPRIPVTLSTLWNNSKGHCGARSPLSCAA